MAPYPLSRLFAYACRLNESFGWRYVVACALTYGVNQAIGDSYVTYARGYYLLDDIEMQSRHYGQISAFVAIPWQIKSLFGLLSDTVPVCGSHTTPYLLLAGLAGLPAVVAITVLPPSAVGVGFAACMFLLCNVNSALGDVIIDGTVAVRSKERPERAADLQGLLWAARNGVGAAASIARGYLLEAGGPRLLFGLSVLPVASLLLPAGLGWVERARPSAPAAALGGRTPAALGCGAVWADPTRRPVAAAALLVGVWSVGLGLLNVLGRDLPGLTAANLALDWLLAALVYVLLRRVDVVLAKAVVYLYLAYALVPNYSPMLFQRDARDDLSQRQRLDTTRREEEVKIDLAAQEIASELHELERAGGATSRDPLWA